MRDPDGTALIVEYRDSTGTVTRRAISPIRWMSSDNEQFTALCLCREEPRTFRVDRLVAVDTVPAHEILMPHPLEVVDHADE